MEDDHDEIEVVVTTSSQEASKRAVVKVIWHEISGGVGIWAAFRPVIAVLLAFIPFLFLGQHFNRTHQRGFDWFLLQIPLSFTLILWVLLYIWSIIDAWKEASIQVADAS